jgi:hypothetical protein
MMILVGRAQLTCMRSLLIKYVTELFAQSLIYSGQVPVYIGSRSLKAFARTGLP